MVAFYYAIPMQEIFKKEALVKLARWGMPFGKFKGTLLIDLPESYLFWFQKRDFPKGELGELMALSLALKIEGLESIVNPLKLENAESLENMTYDTAPIKLKKNQLGAKTFDGSVTEENNELIADVISGILKE